MFKILITDYKWESLDIEREILAPLPGELIVSETGEEDDLVRLAPEADAILTCWKLVTPKVIDAAPKLRIITRYGVGLDNIAVEHATSLGIPVTYSPTYCLEEVAEHALSLVFSMMRRVVRFDRAVRGGDYTGVPYKGMRRIAGKTLGLLGYGNIGRTLARKAGAFGLEILAHDPLLSELPPEEGRLVDFQTLLANSDILSLHVPLTPETTGLIGREALESMKEGAFLVNTSRGPVVVLDDLLESLEVGNLAGAALDVYPEEPPDLGHPLFQHPHFIATPHASFYSEESVEELQRLAANQVFQCLSGTKPDNVVNPQYAAAPPREQAGKR